MSSRDNDKVDDVDVRQRCEDVHDVDASSSIRRRRRRRRRYDVDVVTTTMSSASLSWRQSRHVNVVVTSWLQRRRLRCYRATSYDDTLSRRRRHHDADDGDASSSMRRRRRYDVDVITTTTSSASLSWRQSRHVNDTTTSHHGCRRCHDVDVSMSS